MAHPIRRRQVVWLLASVCAASPLLSPVKLFADGTTYSEYFRRAKKVLVKHLGIDPDDVTEDARFVEDFGADELDLIELMMAFSYEFGVDIDPDAAMLHSVGEVLAYVMNSPHANFNVKGAGDNKSVYNLVLLGQSGHGKDTFTEALVACFGGIRADVKFRGLITAQVEYEAPSRGYVIADCQGHASCIKNLIIWPALEGAIVLVSAADGPTPQTREQMSLARQAGVPPLVEYLNKIDQVDDEEVVELVEVQMRELLNSYEYPGDEIPIVRGSALAALEGRDDDTIGRASILRVMEVVDESILQAKQPEDQPFLMPIEDVFFVSGRGTVVTGRIERGVVKPGEEVEIVGIRPTQKTVVIAIEMFRKQLGQGKAGDNVGILLRGVGKDAVERGQVLCEPGSIMPHKKFKATAYVLTKEEGGRHTPFFTNYRPQFYFRTVDVTGVVTLPAGTEMVMPGDSISFEVELITPIAMEESVKFAIREGGRTIGAGVVTDLIDR